MLFSPRSWKSFYLLSDEKSNPTVSRLVPSPRGESGGTELNRAKPFSLFDELISFIALLWFQINAARLQFVKTLQREALKRGRGNASALAERGAVL